MSKLTAFILCLALCSCDEQQTQERGSRIEFKDYKQDRGVCMSIVCVDSTEFLLNRNSGYMVRITK